MGFYARELVCSRHQRPISEQPVNNNDVETSTVILHSYDLRYISDDADLGGADSTVQVTAPVPPEETANVFLRFLSADAATALGSAVEPGSTSSLIVGVRFYGRTTGGLEVETPETFLGVTVRKDLVAQSPGPDQCREPPRIGRCVASGSPHAVSLKADHERALSQAPSRTASR